MDILKILVLPIPWTWTIFPFIYFINIYIYLYIYKTVKRNEIMPFAATWMDIDTITLSEGSQAEKDKYHMASLKCGI